MKLVDSPAADFARRVVTIPIGSHEPHPRPAEPGRQSGSPGAAPSSLRTAPGIPRAEPRRELSAGQLAWLREKMPSFADAERRSTAAREETARMKAGMQS